MVLKIYQIMTQDEIANILEQVIVSIQNSISNKDEVKNETNKIYITSFFSTIIQYGRAITNSIKSNDLISIPPLLRSQFEAYVDLINLCKYKNYHKVLYAIYLKQQEKMLQETFDNSDNPFFKDTIKHFPDRGSEIKKIRGELKRVENEISNFKGDYTKIKTRFEFAGLEETYTSIYSLLCQDTHNDLLRLESRHLYKKNGQIKIATNTNWSIETIDSHVLTMLHICESSLEETFHSLGYEKPQKTLEFITNKEAKIRSYFDQQYH